MAIATPVDDGYLSVRLKPSSDLLETISEAYARILDAEESAENQGLSKDEIIKAGLACLTRELESLGFDDYVDFMQYAIATEMVSRKELSPRKVRKGRSVVDPTAQNFELQNAIIDLIDQNERCEECLDEMLGRIVGAPRGEQVFSPGLRCECRAISVDQCDCTKRQHRSYVTDNGRDFR